MVRPWCQFLPSASFGDTPLTELLPDREIDALVERTREGGAEIVGLLKTGSAYYAPSSAAAVMARAVLNDEPYTAPVCAWLTGQYGVSDVYLGVPARLGAGGVQEIIELPLTETERRNLYEAADAVRAKVAELAELVVD